jgi:hypothetical protein
MASRVQFIQGETIMSKTAAVTLRNVLLLGASLLPLVVLAHHSRAHYGQEIVELDAEIVDIDWRNPHVTFTMKAMNEAGEEEMWELEGGSTYMLGRYSGLGRDLFTVGDQVKIAGPISTLRPNEMLVTNMLLPDGNEAVMLPNRPPRWSDGVDGADLSLQTNNTEPLSCLEYRPRRARRWRRKRSLHDSRSGGRASNL